MVTYDLLKKSKRFICLTLALLFSISTVNVPIVSADNNSNSISNNVSAAAPMQATKPLKRDKTEIIVKYKNQSTNSLSANALTASSLTVESKVVAKLKLKKLKIKKKLRKGKAELLEVQDQVNINQVVNELKKDPSVEYAQPNYSLTLDDDSSNSSNQGSNLNEQWGLSNNGQIIAGQAGVPGVDVNASKAWNIANGENVLVGVLDTGIDINHQDLSNNIYHNSKEIAGNGIDDDNNGLTDDVNGWDFANNDNSVYDSSSNDSHGTHVAGIIAGTETNGGTKGVAPKVKILPLKFISGNSGYTSDAIDAIEYAKSMGVKVINCSWGGADYNEALRDEMASSGILFICAAGNNGQDVSVKPTYPACFDLPNVISVAAVNNQGQLASFSNYGSKIDVAAPGCNIKSTLPQNNYGYMSGTSMAAPFVAGEAAMLLSKNPSMQPSDIKGKIEQNVTKLSSLNAKVTSGGIINCFGALTGSGNTSPVINNDGNQTGKNNKRRMISIDESQFNKDTKIPFNIIMDSENNTSVPKLVFDKNIFPVKSVRLIINDKTNNSSIYNDTLSLNGENNSISLDKLVMGKTYELNINIEKGDLIYSFLGDIDLSSDSIKNNGILKNVDKEVYISPAKIMQTVTDSAYDPNSASDVSGYTYMTVTGSAYLDDSSKVGVSGIVTSLGFMPTIPDGESAKQINDGIDNYISVTDSNIDDMYKIQFAQNGNANFWLGLDKMPPDCSCYIDLCDENGNLLVSSVPIAYAPRKVGQQNKIIRSYPVTAGKWYYIFVKGTDCLFANNSSTSVYDIKARNYPTQVTPTQPTQQATATISATPNPCPISSSGTGTTTITWNSDAQEVALYVGTGNDSDPMVSKQGPGAYSVSIPWIAQCGGTFYLCDYSTGSKGARLASVTVTGVTATMSATPNPCPISSTGTGTTTITWNSNAQKVALYVGTGSDSDPWVTMQGPGTYSVGIPWITASGDNFYLCDYSSGSKGTVLASTTVNPVTATISATPNPCPISSSGTGTTTITWNSNAQVVALYVGTGNDSDPMVSKEGSGTYSVSIPWITASGGTFYLCDYSSGSKGTKLASVTVTGAGLPDLIITNVWCDPINPVKDQPVVYHATIKNQGTSSTPSGVPYGAIFHVDSNMQTWKIASSDSLVPGATVTVDSDPVTCAYSGGAHTLSATVDDVNRISESDENNNVTSQIINSVDNTSTSITSLTSSENENTTNSPSYKIYAKVANSSSTVSKVAFSTWTSANGKDDINPQWSTQCLGTYTGDDTWEYVVNTSDHNYEAGEYITDVYAYDNAGNCSAPSEIKVTVNPPPIPADGLIDDDYLALDDDQAYLSDVLDELGATRDTANSNQFTLTEEDLSGNTCSKTGTVAVNSLNDQDVVNVGDFLNAVIPDQIIADGIGLLDPSIHGNYGVCSFDNTTSATVYGAVYSDVYSFGDKISNNTLVDIMSITIQKATYQDKNKANVKNIQKALISAGYWINTNGSPRDPKKATGIYDDSTRASVINFQQHYMHLSLSDIFKNGHVPSYNISKSTLYSKNVAMYNVGVGPLTAAALTKVINQPIIYQPNGDILFNNSNGTSQVFWYLKDKLNVKSMKQVLMNHGCSASRVNYFCNAGTIRMAYYDIINHHNEALNLTKEQYAFLYIYNKIGTQWMFHSKYLDNISDARGMAKDVFRVLFNRDPYYYSFVSGKWEKGTTGNYSEADSVIAIQAHPVSLTDLLNAGAVGAVLISGYGELELFAEGVSTYGLTNTIAMYNGGVLSQNLNAFNEGIVDAEEVLADEEQIVVKSTEWYNISKSYDNIVQDIRNTTGLTSPSRNMAYTEFEFNGAKSIYKAYSSSSDINGFVNLETDASKRIFNTIEVGNYDRYVDTEAKTLEKVAKDLGAMRNANGNIDWGRTNTSGTINLYTELEPCPSCDGVIAQFRQHYPNIKLNVFWSTDY